jgi:hypothetical protein
LSNRHRPLVGDVRKFVGVYYQWEIHMARLFRILLSLVFAVTVAAFVNGCGCGGSGGKSGPPSHSQEELDKAEKLGKDIGINMMEKMNPKQ